MSSELHPSGGGRVLFELSSQDDDGATYAMTVYLAEDALRGTATVDNKGKVALDWSEQPPEWLGKQVGPLLRQVATRRGEGAWPRRVLRWRGPR